MRLTTFSLDGTPRTGVLDADELRDVTEALPNGAGASMQALVDFYAQDPAAFPGLMRDAAAKAPAVDQARATPLPVFTETRHDMVCVGLNYRAHVAETNQAFDAGFTLPQAPIYFSKRVGQPIGDRGVVLGHAAHTGQLDYEAELGVVIGRGGRDIPRDKALEHVFGYTVVNDFSARDLQQRHVQWYKGKSLDTLTAMGPCIATPDELPAPLHLDVQSRVNGELRQNSNTRQFIFDVAYLISDLSQGLTLCPGDIIATGTPAGVGMAMTPPRYLQKGDVVECSIQGLGILTNTVG
ncbi:fumarylacetoacetate hydrolase family protein [Desulfocurvus sp. DL9XJH121]